LLLNSENCWERVMQDNVRPSYINHALCIAARRMTFAPNAKEPSSQVRNE